jgi:hypothetical protein
MNEPRHNSYSRLAQIKRLYIGASKRQRAGILAWFRDQEFGEFVSAMNDAKKMSKKAGGMRICRERAIPLIESLCEFEEPGLSSDDRRRAERGFARKDAP